MQVAHRYLLRVETTNPDLYRKLHPEDHSLQKRIDCLHSLKEVGYQVGTGVMIGLPMQTIDDLVNDILFFKEMDVDMIGMGPYIVSDNTPTAEYIEDYSAIKENSIQTCVKNDCSNTFIFKRR
jgi:biotin synthase